jgi:hypothetical protein
MVKIRALTVAVLSGGLVVACGSRVPGAAAPHAPATSGVVAWAGQPATRVPVILRSPPYSTGARPCRPADLSVSHGELGYATGLTNVEVYLTNRSATTCWLDGYPAVAGVAAAGTVTPLPARHGSFFGNPGPSADIRPDQIAALNISGEDNCPAAVAGGHQVYPELLIVLPGGGTVDVRGTEFDAICGMSVSSFGVPADQPHGPAPSPLTARITAGPAARAGTDFTYLVTLANPTARPFPLRSCPSYAEFLGGLMGSGAANSYLVRYYYLNCRAVPAIPPHGSVRYQMKLPLPAGLPAGFYSKLDWQIQGGTGPATATSLTVEPVPSQARRAFFLHIGDSPGHNASQDISLESSVGRGGSPTPAWFRSFPALSFLVQPPGGGDDRVRAGADLLIPCHIGGAAPSLDEIQHLLAEALPGKLFEFAAGLVRNDFHGPVS